MVINFKFFSISSIIIKSYNHIFLKTNTTIQESVGGIISISFILGGSLLEFLNPIKAIEGASEVF